MAYLKALSLDNGPAKDYLTLCLGELQQDRALPQSYNKLITRMKKQEAIVRIATKLLSRIRYVWKNNCPYALGVVWELKPGIR